MILRRGSKQRSGAAGFSLLELMVVVAIIIVLSVMGAPNFQEVIEETRVERASSELQSLWISQRLHYLQTGRFANDLDELLQADLLPEGAKGETVGYEFAIKHKRKESPSLVAVRDRGSGWSGELKLGPNGHLTGKINNGDGHEVKP